jgi:predicted nucleic acid-binding protein
MQVVADTNIFLAVALNEPEKPRILQMTVGAELFAPEILPYEIGNALSAMVKRQRLSAAQARSALVAARSIPVRLLSIDIADALQSATDFGLYAYDAYVLQCARSVPAPLLTLDGRMRQVAAELKIPLLD